LEPDWFFLYLLPPIALEAGYFMPNKEVLKILFRKLILILSSSVTLEQSQHSPSLAQFGIRLPLGSPCIRWAIIFTAIHRQLIYSSLPHWSVPSIRWRWFAFLRKSTSINSSTFAFLAKVCWMMPSQLYVRGNQSIHLFLGSDPKISTPKISTHKISINKNLRQNYKIKLYRS